jgi:hypothetical protein
MNYIYDLHRAMMAQKLIIVYQGEFTQETTKSILAMAERTLDSSGEESGIKRKVFNVMVEALQNIVKHSSEANAAAGSLTSQNAIFMIARQADQYCILTGNPIKKSATAALKQKLDNLNLLDKEGLKEMYKDIIKNTHISDKGGAGLGFVDMARKSGEKLEYNFPEMDDDYNFFSFKVNIAREVSS